MEKKIDDTIKRKTFNNVSLRHMFWRLSHNMEFKLSVIRN